MKISRLELYHLRLPLVHQFQTSFSRVAAHDSLIIRLLTANGAEGYGEVPASTSPYYCYETVETAWYIIKNFLAPSIFSEKSVVSLPVRGSDSKSLFARWHKVRGHPMAKAGMEMALLCLKADITKKPLHQVYGGQRKFISAGISLGIEDKFDTLLKLISDAVRKGYQRIKVKIQPGWDINILRQIRKSFPDINLWVDANGAYTLNDYPILRQLDKFRLGLIEQPLAYDDLLEHSTLQEKLKTPLCLDESIKTLHDAQLAVKLRSCRVVNIKQSRVGGPANARAIHDFLYRRNIPVWCGGLLETGVGRLHNIALASLPGFTMPADLSESQRYYKQDIIDPPVVLEPDGTIRVPTQPGLGAQVIKSRLTKYTIRKLSLK